MLWTWTMVADASRIQQSLFYSILGLVIPHIIITMIKGKKENGSFSCGVKSVQEDRKPQKGPHEKRIMKK